MTRDQHRVTDPADGTPPGAADAVRAALLELADGTREPVVPLLAGATRRVRRRRRRNMGLAALAVAAVVVPAQLTLGSFRDARPAPAPTTASLPHGVRDVVDPLCLTISPFTLTSGGFLGRDTSILPQDAVLTEALKCEVALRPGSPSGRGALVLRQYRADGSLQALDRYLKVGHNTWLVGCSWPVPPPAFWVRTSQSSWISPHVPYDGCRTALSDTTRYVLVAEQVIGSYEDHKDSLGWNRPTFDPRPAVRAAVDPRCHDVTASGELPRSDGALPADAVISEVMRCERTSRTVDGREWSVLREYRSIGDLTPLTRALKRTGVPPHGACPTDPAPSSYYWVRTDDGAWTVPLWPALGCGSGVKFAEHPDLVLVAEQLLDPLPTPPTPPVATRSAP